MSHVWENFRFDIDTNKSTCTVKKLGEQKICGKLIPGKFPTNLKNHLHSTHPQEFAAILQKEASDKKKKATKESERQQSSLKASHQLTLADSFKLGKHYDKSSSRNLEITRKLAIFVGSSNVCLNIVENLEFRDLLSTLDSHYSAPSRTLIVKEVQKILIELKAKISSYLDQARKVSICADAW